MKFTPDILIVILVALAALHAWWGVGGRWPGHDERSLVELVIGSIDGSYGFGLAEFLA